MHASYCNIAIFNENFNYLQMPISDYEIIKLLSINIYNLKHSTAQHEGTENIFTMHASYCNIAIFNENFNYLQMPISDYEIIKLL